MTHKAIVILSGDKIADLVCLAWARNRIVGLNEVHAISLWDAPQRQVPAMLAAREHATGRVQSHFNIRADVTSDGEMVTEPSSGLVVAAAIVAAAMRAAVIGANHIVVAHRDVPAGIGSGLVNSVERVLFLSTDRPPAVHAPMMFLDDDGVVRLCEQLGVCPPGVVP